MDCEVSEDRTVIEAYGNERYSTSATEKLLELLTEIAPIQEGSEIDFCGEDQTYWRFIFKISPTRSKFTSVLKKQCFAC